MLKYDQKNDVKAIESSGNIFKDLGFSNPEEALAKAALAAQLYKIIKDRKLTQEEAAQIMGVEQPRVSEIVCGKLSKYTVDRLLRYLLQLGQDIEICVTTHTRKTSQPSISVIDSREPARKRKGLRP